MFVNAFKELQLEMLEKGYYLLDISDPFKSKKFVLSFNVEKPPDYDSQPILWHGLNFI